MSDHPLRNLPSVNDVLEAAPVRALGAEHAHELIVATVRQELTELRRQFAQGDPVDGKADVAAVAARVVARLVRELKPKLRAVINAILDALHRRVELRHIDMPATPHRVWEMLNGIH